MKKIINCKVDEKDYLKIKEVAKTQGKTLSDYIRDRVLVSAKKEYVANEGYADEFIKILRDIQTQVIGFKHTERLAPIDDSDIQKPLQQLFKEIRRTNIAIEELAKSKAEYRVENLTVTDKVKYISNE